MMFDKNGMYLRKFEILTLHVYAGLRGSWHNYQVNCHRQGTRHCHSGAPPLSLTQCYQMDIGPLIIS